MTCASGTRSIPPIDRFRSYLLEGFEHLEVLDSNGNNEVSAEELFAYAQPRTTAYETAMDFESVQHPQIFDGCEGEAALVRLATLTVDADPRVASATVNGEFYPDLPVSVPFLPGTNHTFTVQIGATIEGDPGTRYTFRSWNDGVTSASRTVDISGTASCTAGYTTQHYLSVETDLAGVEGEGWYDAGAEVSLSADTAPQETPGTSRTFLAWAVDGASVAGNPITVRMDAARAVSALCATRHQLTVLSAGGGAQGSGWYDVGSEAPISASPSAGFLVRRVFDGWSGDCSSDQRESVVVMDAPKTVEALWRTDCTQLYAVMAAIGAAGILYGGYLLWKKRRAC